MARDWQFRRRLRRVAQNFSGDTKKNLEVEKKEKKNKYLYFRSSLRRWRPPSLKRLAREGRAGFFLSRAVVPSSRRLSRSLVGGGQSQARRETGSGHRHHHCSGGGF